MNNNEIPVSLDEVKNQVALMKERGFSVKEDDVIADTLQRGLQNLVDIRTDGHYYTVHWTPDKTFEIRGIGAVVEGHIQPKGDNFVEDFKNNAPLLWDYLGDQASKIVGR